MARQLVPRQGETLAAFLDRALEEREVKINALARQLSAADGSSGPSWQRSLRRWTAGTTASISEENAAVLGAALNADFTAFHRGTNGTGVRDLLTQALKRLEELESQVAALERRAKAPQSR